MIQLRAFVALAPLLRPHAELQGRARGEQNEGEDQRLDRVELGPGGKSRRAASAACCGRGS